MLALGRVASLPLFACLLIPCGMVVRRKGKEGEKEEEMGEIMHLIKVRSEERNC